MATIVTLLSGWEIYSMPEQWYAGHAIKYICSITIWSEKVKLIIPTLVEINNGKKRIAERQ